jgi:hypothetical protein
MAHYFAAALQAIHRANRAQDMSGICSLATSGYEQFLRLAHPQEGSQEDLLSRALHQARSEFAQHGTIEAGIAQFKSQRILPIDPTSHGVGRLPV